MCLGVDYGGSSGVGVSRSGQACQVGFVACGLGIIENCVRGLTGAVHAQAEGAESVDAGAGALRSVAVRVAQRRHPPLHEEREDTSKGSRLAVIAARKRVKDDPRKADTHWLFSRWQGYMLRIAVIDAKMVCFGRVPWLCGKC